MMELNREQIEKALDWLDSLVGNSNDSDIALFTYQLLGILYDTCEELTEKNAIQVVTLIELDKQVSIVKADTVRKMQERFDNRIKDKLAYHGWYLKETVIPTIAKEMLEGTDDEQR